MECPKCKYVRQESDSIVPDWQCPKCGVVYAKVRVPPPPPVVINSIFIRMASGLEFSVQKIKLYDLKLIQEFDALKKAAAHNLAGYSTGLGFWGGLEWVAVGSLATKVVQGVVSDNMRQKGIEQMSLAVQLSDKIRKTGVFAPVSKIGNIAYPDPTIWGCPLDVNGTRMALVSIPNNYVFVESDGIETAIFWDKVEQYRVV